MEGLVFLLAILLFFVGILYLVLAYSYKDKNQENKRLKLKIMNLERPIDKKDENHKICWNNLWLHIRNTFNFYNKTDNTVNGGQPVKEIYKLLRTEFGKFDISQIRTIEYIITCIAKAQENQLEDQLSKNPIGQEIVFDNQGGFKVISKIQPSLN